MKQLVKNWANLFVGAGIGVLLVAITWVVRLDGGVQGVYDHVYYIPIIAASYFLGDLGGVMTAFCAAGLAAILPFDTSTGAAQPALDIVVRAILFGCIGFMTARLFAKLEERRADAASLVRVSNSVNASLRPTEVLRLIAETAVRITAAKACSLRLLNREGTQLIPAASYGLSLDYLAKAPPMVPGNSLDQAVIQGETITCLDLQCDPRFDFQEEARREGLVSLLGLPLRRGETVFGALSVYSGARHQWSSREARLLQAFAELAGIAIHNARLHEDLRKNYFETVSALARAIEAKDPVALGHSERVTDYALQLGAAAGLPAEEMETLRFAATLHDIGKLGVSEDGGPGMDFEDELVMRMHPLIGISILQPVEFLGPALAAVRSHHERWDGNGYPEGLTGEEIPRLGRMLAIADSFDRLQMEGPGRASLSPEDAVRELRLLAGTALDPELTDAFVRAFEREL